MIYDRLIRPIQNLVNALIARVDYHAMYLATVQAQNGNTVDIQPVDDRWPGMQNVLVRWGMPGAQVTFEQGAQVLFGFVGGDPAQPYVVGWDHDSTTLDKWQFDQSPAGSDKGSVARVGDTVDTGLQIMVASSPPAVTVTFIYTPPDGGAPQQLVLVMAGSASSAGSFPTTGTIVGSITSGASKVMA